MNQILELREKRAKAWDAAKAFLDSKRGADGMLSAEDAATYDKMEADVVNLGKEIERLERQAAIDRELNQPLSKPITERPGAVGDQGKTGRATDEYKAAFWRTMRAKSVPHEVLNALQVGVESEGGYLAPDEYERTLIEALEEQNIFRQFAHVIHTSSGDRKIPVVASKGTASWIDEEAAYPESDDSFGQVSIGAYKLATMIKVSEELLNDSVFDLPSYIAREFARRIGAAEEEAFFNGNGTGQTAGHSRGYGRRGDRRHRRQRHGHHHGRDHGPVLQPARALPSQRRIYYERFDRQGHPQAEERQRRLPLAAFGDGGYARYAAQPPRIHLQLHARHRRRQQGHPFWRPRLLLGRRPRGPFLQTLE